MKYLFAPLEGITGYIFRTTYDSFFGGIDTYYTPFVTTRDGGIMKNKEKKDIMPENNSGINLVPQIMTAKSDEFIQAAKHMEDMGYREVNLNLGCPSGTVVPKGKGSGFLREPEKLDLFLEDIYNRCPIDISIKTRIGFDTPEEFENLLEIYNKYPIKLLIIHPRTRQEMYTGNIHPETFEYAYKNTKNPLCYNGDITTMEKANEIQKKYPDIDSIMIGRGYLRFPGFVGNADLKGNYQKKTLLLDFAEELKNRYAEVLYGDRPLLFKMKELWSHMKDSFSDGDEIFKRIKKCKIINEYDSVITQLKIQE
ncbi:MAG: tRNA-dihydrouridine synthase family protein [Eubacterium sp.]|nr:tRNA-dihydrouridine synthase family protein [Eubacterium sp.]